MESENLGGPNDEVRARPPKFRNCWMHYAVGDLLSLASRFMSAGQAEMKVCDLFYRNLSHAECARVRME